MPDELSGILIDGAGGAVVAGCAGGADGAGGTGCTSDIVVACIFCAMKTEAKPFLTAMSQKRLVAKKPARIYEGLIGGKYVALGISGVGTKKAAATAKALIDCYQPPCLIVSGTAGAMDTRMKINDTAIANETVFHDVSDDDLRKEHPGLTSVAFDSDARLLAHCKQALKHNPPPQDVYFGRVATGDSFVREKYRADIIERINPLCVDMETAAVALECQLYKTPFLAVRSITDNQERPGVLTFIKYVRSASESSFRVVEALLGKLSQHC